MRYAAASLSLLLACSVQASADCYADYKAKQDNPLRLAYGVAALTDEGCGGRAAASVALAPRLAAAGWTLMSIVSIFGPEGLDERKASAGAFFLRY